MSFKELISINATTEQTDAALTAKVILAGTPTILATPDEYLSPGEYRIWRIPGRSKGSWGLLSGPAVFKLSPHTLAYDHLLNYSGILYYEPSGKFNADSSLQLINSTQTFFLASIDFSQSVIDAWEVYEKISKADQERPEGNRYGLSLLDIRQVLKEPVAKLISSISSKQMELVGTASLDTFRLAAAHRT